MSKEETEQDEVKRLIPNPSEIKAIIDKNKGKNSQIILEIDKRFDKVIKKNNKATDSTTAAAIKKWNVFKKDNKDKFESLDHKVFVDFYNDYLKFYNKTVLPMLSEEFVSSQELMQEIFGILYEDDTGDEKSKADSDDVDSDVNDDFEDDGGDEGSSDDKSEDGKENEVTNIFIVPMNGIDVKIDNSGSQ